MQGHVKWTSLKPIERLLQILFNRERKTRKQTRESLLDAFSEVRSGKGLEIVLRNKVKVRSRYLPPIFIDVEDYICETIYTLVPGFSLILAQATLLMEQWLLYLFPLAIVGQSRQSRLLWRDVPLVT